MQSVSAQCLAQDSAAQCRNRVGPLIDQCNPTDFSCLCTQHQAMIQCFSVCRGDPEAEEALRSLQTDTNNFCTRVAPTPNFNHGSSWQNTTFKNNTTKKSPGSRATGFNGLAGVVTVGALMAVTLW